MAAETISRMTPSEFKEMLETVVEATVERTLLEMLGDPDEGLEIRGDVRDRLLRQRQGVVGLGSMVNRSIMRFTAQSS